MRATIALAALACTLFLPACGIKGPLYLPPVPEEGQTTAPAEDQGETTAPAASDDGGAQP
ncbi:MAG: lipoprotein [Azoarcus sp.]|jgi:predicted small lipoprotein YifL|nr:lipoprotein [Azoarcus sp.]